MYRVICLVTLGFVASSQGQYDLDARPVSFPGKSNGIGGPLYTPGLGTSSNYRDTSYEDNAVTPTPSPTPIYRPSGNQQLYRKPTVSSLDARDYNSPIRVVGNSQRGGPLRGREGPLEEIEEEKEEPDRLTLLLPQSKFDCVNKQTGYYADEELNCEVFHYCQDNARHSWICPEGFTFHQVHLICMPPSGDISCKKSSQYHFVNEYLYKPLNLQEAESKPNVTIRYSERYYPADIYTDEREVAEYQATPSPPIRRPAPPVYLNQQSTTINSIPSSGRPQSQLPQFRLPINQVFRSPEEVNIPLQQRRPQQHQAFRRFPQVRQEEEEDYE